MPIRLPAPEDAPKTESGATIGSTGEVVDIQTRTFLKNKAKREARDNAIELAKKAAELRKNTTAKSNVE